MFSIDGLTWPYPCDIERVSEVRSSSISGDLLTGEYFNDVMGTYLQYTVSVAVPLTDRDQYELFYEALNDPVDGHAFVFPYGQGTISITARVDSVSDTFVRLPNGGKYWKGTRFTVTTNHPVKQETLSGVMARGRSPLPEASEVQTGDIYTYTSTGWVLTNYTDADDVAY